MKKGGFFSPCFVWFCFSGDVCCQTFFFSVALLFYERFHYNELQHHLVFEHRLNWHPESVTNGVYLQEHTR